MKSILVVLPQTDFDPTEVAFPWLVWTKAGQLVTFATQTGDPATCDPVTLDGVQLPLLAKSLRARPAAREAYAAMITDPGYRQPIRWDQARVTNFSAVHFPGGHAAGMKPYCESGEVQRIAREAFAAHEPVSAICHGVLPLARAGVIEGKRTTALTAPMEEIAVRLTAGALPGHFRTYPESVEAEVKRLIGPKGQFERGPLLPRYASVKDPHAGFVVQDMRYLSARWPGDAWTLALRLLDLID